MKSKKNILILADWYAPAYKAGGPVRSLTSLCQRLKDEFNFYIITSDKDLFAPKKLPGIESDAWNELPAGEKVFYFSDENFSAATLAELIKTVPHDFIYLNSFFSRHFTLIPLRLQKKGLIQKPVILAPRGMLSSAALSIKPLKKKIFIAIAKLLGLYKNVSWQATSPQEKKDIQKIFGQNIIIKEVSNLAAFPLSERKEYQKTKGELRICTLARISKVKNILFTFEVLKEIHEGKIIFDLYGPAEEKEYVDECKKAAAALPANISVSFKGDLPAKEVEKDLQRYHLFFLPTHTENFGHAIAEAMLNGCIPLISDQTPWKNLEANQAGWDVDLNDKAKFISAIKKVLAFGEKEFEAHSKNAQNFAARRLSDSAKLNAYKELFSAAD